MKQVLVAMMSVLILGACSGDLIDTATLPKNNMPVAAYYALPRALYPLNVVRKNCELSVSLDKVIYVPEPMRFAVQYNPSDFSHDALTVQTDSAGLLAAINATSENQTSAVAGAAADLITKVGHLPFFAAQPKVCTDPDFDISYMMDPAEGETGLKGLHDKLAPSGVILSVLLFKKPEQTTTLPIELNAYSYLNITTKNGIWYHPAIRTDIELKFTSGAKILARQFSVTGPDKDLYYFIPFQRRGAAKLDISLEFDHGMLTKYKSDDQSPLLAVIQLPADIIKSFLGLSTSSSGSAAATPKKSN